MPRKESCPFICSSIKQGRRDARHSEFDGKIQLHQYSPHGLEYRRRNVYNILVSFLAFSIVLHTAHQCIFYERPQGTSFSNSIYLSRQSGKVGVFLSSSIKLFFVKSSPQISLNQLFATALSTRCSMVSSTGTLVNRALKSYETGTSEQGPRKIDNWKGEHIFIYSCSPTVKTIDLKRNEK